MSEPAFEIQVEGDKKAIADFHMAAKRAADIRPVEMKLLKVMTGAARRSFETEGEGTWPPLAQLTKERKEQQGLPPATLIASRKLYDSLTSVHEATVRVTPTELWFGSDQPHARYHETGTEEMPRRQLVKLSFPERKRITRILEEWVARGKST